MPHTLLHVNSYRIISHIALDIALYKHFIRYIMSNGLLAEAGRYNHFYIWIELAGYVANRLRFPVFSSAPQRFTLLYIFIVATCGPVSVNNTPMGPLAWPLGPSIYKVGPRTKYPKLAVPTVSGPVAVYGVL